MKLEVVKHPEELPLPVIRVSGTSEERGVQYGMQAKDLITKALKVYEEIVSRMRPDSVDYESMLKQAKRFLPIVKRYDRELYKEICGIAKGSDLTIEEIMFLNARSEIMNPAWANATVSEGCTSFVLEPFITREHETLIGQTYDWHPGCQSLLVLYLSQNEEGLEVATVTEAGIIAKIGCNNYGIANLLNYLNNYEINEKGTLYHILLRRVLESKNFYEAQRNLLRSPIAFGLNLFIADDHEHAIDYELTANGADFFLPTDHKLLHTNHYLSDHLSIRSFVKDNGEESKVRYQIAKKFLEQKSGDLTLEDLLQMVSIHGIQKESGAICRHSDTDEYNMETIFSMITNLTSHKIYLCIGTPCNHPFYEISMRDLFKEMRTNECG